MSIHLEDYESVDFVQNLTDPELQSIASVALSQDDTTRNVVIVALAEDMEIRIRQRTLALLAATSPVTTESLGSFWKETLLIILHLIHHEKELNDSLTLRKLPFQVLDDILECLTATQGYDFFQEHVLPQQNLLFGDKVWQPDPTHHPAWLPFLKSVNKWLPRLNDKPQHAKAVLQLLAQVFPLGEKSATKAWGSHNDDPSLRVPLSGPEDEDEEDGDDKQAPAEDVSQQSSRPDASVFQAFWAIQHDFRNPNSIPVAAFLERLEVVCRTFEGHARQNVPEDLSSTSSTNTIAKYLPYSRLWRIQLSNVDFMCHILSQLLICCQHLQLMVPNLEPKLQPYVQRAQTLLQEEAPAPYARVLQQILQDAEGPWRQWKRNKCQPDLDRILAPPVPEEDQGPRKRARWIFHESKEPNKEMIVNKGETLAQVVTEHMQPPALRSHLQDYVEALDPEAGIEGEYHPKNDSRYVWRSIRLLAPLYVGEHFEKISVKGDVMEGLVRHVYEHDFGVTIPGSIPEEQEEKEDWMLEEETQNVKVVQNVEDMDVQDVSEAEQPIVKPESDDDVVNYEEEEETREFVKMDGISMIEDFLVGEPEESTESATQEKDTTGKKSDKVQKEDKKHETTGKDETRKKDTSDVPDRKDQDSGASGRSRPRWIPPDQVNRPPAYDRGVRNGEGRGGEGRGSESRGVEGRVGDGRRGDDRRRDDWHRRGGGRGGRRR